MKDLGKEIRDDSYVDNIYLSIRDVGTKVFKNCVFFVEDGWMFIWTREESFCIREKDMGDFLVIDANSTCQVELKKV